MVQRTDTQRGWRVLGAVVRVKGPNTEAGLQQIDALADKVAGLLDIGEYRGPKNLVVGTAAAEQVERHAVRPE